MRHPVVLVYSNRADVRAEIMLAVGRRPGRDLPPVEFLECSGIGEVLEAVDGQGADLLILDGEAQPAGGMAVSRHIHQEAAVVPPMVLLVRRADDRWLATWSQVDEVMMYPLDPVTAAETVASVLRRIVPADAAATSTS